MGALAGVGRLLHAAGIYARLAFFGLVEPRMGGRELVVVQGVVLSERGILLSVRSDLQGWELPGGTQEAGEADEATLVREILEETGIRVRPVRHVGDYVRTGFLPHRAVVFLCRAEPDDPLPSRETPTVRWHGRDAIPDTLFPWYRAPIEDAFAALAGAEAPVRREERQGLDAILAGFRIDMAMRWRKDH